MKTDWKIVKIIAGMLLIAVTAVNIGCSKTVATVNGEKISQAELNERLMQKAGKQILNEMITEKLILQEAEKKNIKVSPKEINERVDELKSRFPNEESFYKNLEENNMTLDQFKEQIKIQIITKKVLEKKVKVSDEEIKNYYEQNKETIYKDKKFEEVKDQIKNQLEQQKLFQRMRTWINDLKKKAEIKNMLESKK